VVTKRTVTAKAGTKKVATPPDNRFHDYELTIILKPDLEEARVNTIIDNITNFIASHEGTLGKVDRWGKRKLAYPIKHFMEGNYTLAQFKMKPVHSKELESSLRISEDILRHLLVIAG
jgi:small subunit ribosomal protein S6